MKRDKINSLNKFKRNLFVILDSKNISEKEGKDKIKEYVKYLSNRTNISKYRLRKMLTYNISNIITADDIDALSEALEVSYEVFFK